MPRKYTRKENALRERVTVPMSVDGLAKLRKFAEQIGVAPTTAARDLIEKNIPEPSVK